MNFYCMSVTVIKFIDSIIIIVVKNFVKSALHTEHHSHSAKFPLNSNKDQAGIWEAYTLYRYFVYKYHGSAPTNFTSHSPFGSGLT